MTTALQKLRLTQRLLLKAKAILPLITIELHHVVLGLDAFNLSFFALGALLPDPTVDRVSLCHVAIGLHVRVIVRVECHIGTSGSAFSVVAWSTQVVGLRHFSFTLCLPSCFCTAGSIRQA